MSEVVQDPAQLCEKIPFFLRAKGVQDWAVIKSLINQLIKAKAAG